MSGVTYPAACLSTNPIFGYETENWHAGDWNSSELDANNETPLHTSQELNGVRKCNYISIFSTVMAVVFLSLRCFQNCGKDDTSYTPLARVLVWRLRITLLPVLGNIILMIGDLIANLLRRSDSDEEWSQPTEAQFA